MTDWQLKVKIDGKTLKKKYIVPGKNQLIFNNDEQRYKMFDKFGKIDEKFSSDIKEYINSVI